jgi:hypothetical protein
MLGFVDVPSPAVLNLWDFESLNAHNLPFDSFISLRSIPVWVSPTLFPEVEFDRPSVDFALKIILSD